MTSIPPQPNPQQLPHSGLPPTATHTPSYLGTAPPSGRHPHIPPSAEFSPNASGSANMSNAVGGNPTGHGHSESMNGRNPTLPAVPNGNPFPPGDHTRKTSMTVTPTGVTGGFPNNGGAVGGGQNKLNNLQFGSVNTGGSPAMGTPPSLANQSSNLSVSSLNPRIGSPGNSPSPIPQPVSASGGKPPSTLQSHGNGPRFGQFEGEGSETNVSVEPIPSGPAGDSLTKTGYDATSDATRSPTRSHAPWIIALYA